MKKVDKRLLSLLIVLTFIFVNINVQYASAKSIDATILAKIEELCDKLEDTYFTVDRSTGCGEKNSNHSCDNCYNEYIANAEWFKEMFGECTVDNFSNSHSPTGQLYRRARSCAGFAHFAEWYIFKSSNSDTITTEKIGTYDYNYDNILAYAKVGDILRLDNSHSVIFISADENGITVLDSNWTGDYNCIVDKHNIVYVRSNGNKRYSTFTIARAENRDAGVTPPPVDPKPDVSTAPTLTVEADTTDVDTIFSWDSVSGASSYDLKIWKNSSLEGDAYITKTNVSSGISISLGEGTYYACVDAYNYDKSSQKRSNVVSFELENADLIKGIYGEDITWEYNIDTNHLNIIGTGEMPDDESPWEHMPNLKSVHIADGVTSIGKQAFRGCYNLTSITIPNSLISIGESAFTSCKSLTSITIPDSVTNIGNSVFENCRNLTNITIPDGVSSIGYEMFSGCSSLTNITIPNSVTSIGKLAFNDCTSLSNITIPNGVTSIGESAFHDCINLSTITIPNSVTSIGTYAFYDCTSLTDIVVPEGVTIIDRCAFGNCTSLTSITIPDSVTNIGNSVFENCRSLTNITIPDGVTSIGYEIFSGCSSLIDITIPNNVTSISTRAFYDCTNLLNITIPNSVTKINGSAFHNCTSLSNITISNCIKAIGENTFYECTNLTDVYYNGTRDEWEKIIIWDGNESLTNATIHYIGEEIHYHEWDDGAIILEPTVDAEGIKVYTCPCGETKTEFIERLPKPEYVPGDANEDECIDIKDVISLRRFITGGYGIYINEDTADVNNDLKVDIKDAIVIRRFIAGGYDIELQ